MNKHKNGFLIEPGDEEALKDRLELLLNNPELRRTMGREGRRHVEREFSAEKEVAHLLSLLKEAHNANV